MFKDYIHLIISHVYLDWIGTYEDRGYKIKRHNKTNLQNQQN